MHFNNHIYKYTNPFGWVNHRWELICHDGGIHFHASVPPKSKDNSLVEVSAGLEFHSVTGTGAPDHINCQITGGRCWHDGTSSYAMETLWPQIAVLLKHGDHGSIFKLLEHEAQKYFDRQNELKNLE